MRNGTRWRLWRLRRKGLDSGQLGLIQRTNFAPRQQRACSRSVASSRRLLAGSFVRTGLTCLYSRSSDWQSWSYSVTSSGYYRYYSYSLSRG